MNNSVTYLLKIRVQEECYYLQFDFQTQYISIISDKTHRSLGYTLERFNIECLADIYKEIYYKSNYWEQYGPVVDIQKILSSSKKVFSFATTIAEDVQKIKNADLDKEFLPIQFEPNVFYLKKLREALSKEIKAMNADVASTAFSNGKKVLKNMRRFVKYIDDMFYVSRYLEPPVTKEEIEDIINLKYPVPYIKRRSEFIPGKKYPSKSIILRIMDKEAQRRGYPFLLPAMMCKNGCTKHETKLLHYIWYLKNGNDLLPSKLSDIFYIMGRVYLESSKKDLYTNFVKRYNEEQQKSI